MEAGGEEGRRERGPRAADSGQQPSSRRSQPAESPRVQGHVERRLFKRQPKRLSAEHRVSARHWATGLELIVAPCTHPPGRSSCPHLMDDEAEARSPRPRLGQPAGQSGPCRTQQGDRASLCRGRCGCACAGGRSRACPGRGQLTGSLRPACPHLQGWGSVPTPAPPPAVDHEG